MNNEVTTDDTDEANSVDTEGHAFRSGRVARPAEGDAADDDTEGHAIRSGRVAPAAAGEALDDDTEGHAIRSGRLAPVEGDLVGDDTEGHMYIPKDERTGGSEPMAMRGKVEPAGEDDTEGHAARFKG